MEIDKKDVIIVILLTIIIVLMGLIFYKVITKEDVDENLPINESTDSGTVSDSDEIENIVMIAEKIDLYQTMRDSDIDPVSNVENETVKIGNIDFKVDCTDYDEDSKTCNSVSLNYKNKTLETSDINDYLYVYVTSKQIITINGSFMSMMRVYDYDGKLIYDNEIVKEYNKSFGSNDSTYLGIELEDNKLYFYTCNDVDIIYTEADKSTIYKNSMDLIDADYKISRVGELKGYIGMFY